MSKKHYKNRDQRKAQISKFGQKIILSGIILMQIPISIIMYNIDEANQKTPALLTILYIFQSLSNGWVNSLVEKKYKKKN